MGKDVFDEEFLKYYERSDLLQIVFSKGKKTIKVFIDDDCAETATGEKVGWKFSSVSGVKKLYVGVVQSGVEGVFIARYEEDDDRLILEEDEVAEKVLKEFQEEIAKQESEESVEKEQSKRKSVFRRLKDKLAEKFAIKEKQSKKPALITLSIFYGLLFLLSIFFVGGEQIFGEERFLRMLSMGGRFRVEFYELINYDFIGTCLCSVAAAYLLYLNSHKIFKKKAINVILIIFGIMYTLSMAIGSYFLYKSNLNSYYIFANSLGNFETVAVVLTIVFTLTALVNIIGNLYFCKGLSNTPHIVLGILAPVISVLFIAFIIICYILIFVKAIFSFGKETVAPMVKESEMGQAFSRGYNGGSTKTQYEVWEDGYKRVLTYYDYSYSASAKRYKDDIGHFWLEGKDGKFFRE